MDDACTTVVNKVKVLEPAIVPAPSQTDRKDETWGYKRKKDVGIGVSSLSNGASRDGGHHDAKWQVVDKVGIVWVTVVQPNEVILAKDTTLGIYAESKSYNKES